MNVDATLTTDNAELIVNNDEWESTNIIPP
jgi:hypothetical protein